uniref:hypothetical protein n=1 Tax=Chitinophaga sp. TaxID=1869181 RepID=UPI002FDD490A
MNKLFIVFIILPLLGCRFVGDAAAKMEEKCISEKLAMQENSPRVIEIRKSFDDTFLVWRKDLEIFGSDKYLDHFIDEMVFLSKDSSRCILLVLKRAKEGMTPNMFGTARVIKGRKNYGVWNFFASQEFLYERDFFVKYEDNS